MTFRVLEITPPRKAHEMRVRRAATRWGFALRRCPVRRPGAAGYATYALVDDQGAAILSEPDTGYGKTLDEVETFLARIAALFEARKQAAS